MNYSPAVWLVWRMAALIANRERTLIEPKQFLSATFSLATLPKSEEFGDADAKSELEEVFNCFESVGLQWAEILGRLQTRNHEQNTMTLLGKQSHSGNAISRSAVTKKAFDLAASAAAEDSLDCARLRHLVGALLFCSEELHPVLGIKQTFADQLVASLLHLAPPAPPKIVQTLDATRVLEPEIDWSTVGQKFAHLCELTWAAGAGGNMNTLLQLLTEKILDFVPRATHAAILILDPVSTDLYLKADSPRGQGLPSRSSAQQALTEKKAFIWQRGEAGRDLTMTQIDSQAESGVYAPIIAGGKSFGVICLSSRSTASHLTPEDLFLAASLGHQIGLVLDNQELKAEIADKINVLERLMTNFSPQVRTRLIQLAQKGQLKLGGERSTVSILCADIRGFTLMSAGMDTADLIALLNDYFTAMVECVFRHGGTIDKFIGDALLVVFGSPEVMQRHAEQAIKTAIALQGAIEAVSDRRRKTGVRACEIGIGVHTGEVIHGFIGSPERMEFTIIGDPVNMTTRYCSGAGGGEIIISPEIREKLWGDLRVDSVELNTKEGILSAFKLLGMRGSQLGMRI
jgi:adenylate cyclase